MKSHSEIPEKVVKFFEREIQDASAKAVIRSMHEEGVPAKRIAYHVERQAGIKLSPEGVRSRICRDEPQP